MLPHCIDRGRGSQSEKTPRSPHTKGSKNVTRPRSPGVGDGRTRLGAEHRRREHRRLGKRGVVTLTGHVQSFPQKVVAERAAARVKGVKAVAGEIAVKLRDDVRRGDENIARAVVERLVWDATVPPDAVEIKVEKGWVTLNGEVDWQFQKEAAAQAVRTLIGVVGFPIRSRSSRRSTRTMSARTSCGRCIELRSTIQTRSRLALRAARSS